MLTAVLFVPLAVLVHKVLAPQGTPYMAVATAFGVVGGVVQFLGLVLSAVPGPLPGGCLPRSGIERYQGVGRRRFPGVQPVRGRRSGREPRLPLHRPVDVVGRPGHVRIGAAVEKVAGPLGSGVGSRQSSCA